MSEGRERGHLSRRLSPLQRHIHYISRERERAKVLLSTLYVAGCPSSSLPIFLATAASAAKGGLWNGNRAMGSHNNAHCPMKKATRRSLRREREKTEPLGTAGLSRGTHILAPVATLSLSQLNSTLASAYTRTQGLEEYKHERERESRDLYLKP